MLHTSFSQTWQERRLHHAVVEILSNAVIVPQGFVVHVHESTLQLPNLYTKHKADDTMAFKIHCFLVLCFYFSSLS